MAQKKQAPVGGNKPKPGGNTPKPGNSAKDRSRQQSRAVSTKAPSGRGGSAGGGKRGGGPGGPKGKGGPVPPPRRISVTTMTWGGVGLVIVVVLVLVLVNVLGSGTSNASYTPVTPAPASVVNKVTNIPTSVYDKVGVTSAVQLNPPVVLSSQPPLTFDGKPGILYVGAEYCPYCGAERWALIAALSRFGTFSNLKVTASSHTDVDPATNTFSFQGSTYTSPYITFQPVEQLSNIPEGESYQPLDKITKAQQAILNKYEQPPIDPDATAGQFGYPFVDIANKAIITGPAYNPGILANLSHSEIADGLSDPSNQVGQAIVASANYISATICAATGNKPASVCQSSGVQAAAKALKLS